MWLGDTFSNSDVQQRDLDDLVQTCGNLMLQVLRQKSYLTSFVSIIASVEEERRKQEEIEKRRAEVEEKRWTAYNASIVCIQTQCCESSHMQIPILRRLEEERKRLVEEEQQNVRRQPWNMLEQTLCFMWLCRYARRKPLHPRYLSKDLKKTYAANAFCSHMFCIERSLHMPLQLTCSI